MFKVAISRLPVRRLNTEELRIAPVVLIGDARLVAERFPTRDFPNIIGGMCVKSPNREHTHYISLLERIPDTDTWRRAENDPRAPL